MTINIYKVFLPRYVRIMKHNINYSSETIVLI